VVLPSASDTERKIVSILKILSESPEPLGSITIARELERLGIFLSERAVRYHLRIMDERGYTQSVGRDGRMITETGMEEVKEALAPQQLGFIRERLEMLAFQTTFDPSKRTGQLSVNLSVMDKNKFADVLAAAREAIKAGLCVSDLVATANEGEKIGNTVIPRGKFGLATVCSVVINGVLLRSGVPTDYRFGGLLELRNWQPRRFTSIIEYSGTSVDPSEMFIRAHTPSVGQAARTGSGKVLGVFRTIPAPARQVLDEKMAQLKEANIGGVLTVGNTSEPVCQIPLGINRIGIVHLGGLNPMAAAVETGIEIENIPESGLIDYERLVSIWKL